MHDLHLAIIMDGNGRWAQRRGLPRTAGHIEGASAVNVIVETAARTGLRALTLYAFSARNWERPEAEVAALMRLLRRYLMTETHRCRRAVDPDQRDRPPRPPRGKPGPRHRVQRAAHCRMLRPVAAHRGGLLRSIQHFRSGAANELSSAHRRRREFREYLDAVDHASVCAGPVDLLIRTGGERRLSDFLLWDCAFAELVFTDCMWPDFAARGFSHRARGFRRPGAALRSDRGRGGRSGHRVGRCDWLEERL